MKQLVILSGKGGTGKTTLAVSLIKLSKNKMFADCDVDAPNVKLIFEDTEILEEKPYFGLKKAFKYDDICIDCGKCEELCRFNAIKDGVVNINYCEGCGVCERFCPVTDDQGRKAIRMEDDSSGTTRVEKLNNEFFSNANLKIGNGASGKLVTEVRKNMYSFKTNEELAIIDGSPGIGCPVIASLTGIGYCILVAEPSISGIHDMIRILETSRNFNTKCFIVINKYDNNFEKTKEIEDIAKEKNVEIIGKIPFDKSVVKITNEGKPVVDNPDTKAAKEIIDIWNKLKNRLDLENQ